MGDGLCRECIICGELFDIEGPYDNKHICDGCRITLKDLVNLYQEGKLHGQK